jgi:hypothetical protein
VLLPTQAAAAAVAAMVQLHRCHRTGLRWSGCRSASGSDTSGRRWRAPRERREQAAREAEEAKVEYQIRVRPIKGDFECWLPINATRTSLSDNHGPRMISTWY